MSRFTCRIDELDEETRDYLDAVRSQKGRRMPGIYVPGHTAQPLLALIIGPVIAFFALMQSFLSTKDAWAVAMLQTAGVLLGGWLVIFAFRRWFASPKRFAGHFTYCDPHHIYQGAGETITITDVSGLTDVDVRHDRSNGSYSGSTLLLEMDSRRLKIPISGQEAAEHITDFYHTLLKLPENPDQRWQNLNDVSRAAVARYVVKHDEFPRNLSEAPMEVEELPENPHIAQRAGFAPLPYLIILLVGGATFAVFWQVNKPIRDERAFVRAKDAGAPGLRGYLIDPRNTRHRAEAEEALAKLYDPAIKKIEFGAKDPQAKQGLLAIMEGLRTAPQPVVSIRVTEAQTPPEAIAGKAGRENQIRMDMADAMAMHLGSELIGFVQAPENTPAHIELEYSITPTGQANNLNSTYTVTWFARFRGEVGHEPITTSTFQMDGPIIQSQLVVFPKTFNNAVFQKLFGQAPPAIPLLPFEGGGDF